MGGLSLFCGSSFLLFRQLQCWTAGHGKVGDDRSFSSIAALGLGEPGGNLALPGRAALLGGPLFCSLLLLLYGYYQNLFLLLTFLFVRL